MPDEQSDKKDILSEPSRVKGIDTNQEIELNLDLSYEVLAFYFEAILPEVGEATRLHMAKAISKNHSRLITEARVDELEAILSSTDELSVSDVERYEYHNGGKPLPAINPEVVQNRLATLNQSEERKQGESE